MIDLVPFLTESLRIEGIDRPPTAQEVYATQRLLDLRRLTVTSIKELVSVYAPHAQLRDVPGRNVRVGAHIPMEGGPEIKKQLRIILDGVNEQDLSPFEAHVAYEVLHPFTDGNGRSGRAIWLWQTRDVSLGFLHRFYYQTLAAQRAI